MPEHSSSSLRIQPQQQRAHDKIERIMKATGELLSAEGLDAVTPAAIAKKAGLPSATVYHYFENRQALLLGLADRTMTRVDADIMAALARLTPDQAPDWRTIVQLIYHSYHAAPGFVPLLHSMRATPQLRGVVEESNLRVAEALARTLQQFSKLDAARLLRVAKLVSESVQAMLELALTTRDALEAEALVMEMQEMVECLYQHYLLKQNLNS
ncbi:MAG TPA: TetR/AcrR family transcriptional regulator [Pseudomonadales bacterium]|nr:TetR/AcrR family transcriptional regulator [Pseudomonadales bacterium]